MSLLNKISPLMKLCKANDNTKNLCKKNKQILAKKILLSADYNLTKIETKSYSNVLISAISAEKNGIIPQFIKNGNDKDYNYKVKRILGCGSGGCVYWAEDKNGKSVIIKSGKDLANEKKILKILNKKSKSPYFPKYIESFKDTVSYLVTIPFLDVDGEPAHDLFNFLREPLSEKNAKILYLNILKAVSEMNKIGIKHKDLKPQNILVNTNLDIQIIDFGVACYSSDSRCTYGFTRRYQPEGYTGKNLEYSNISDVYSVIQILGDIIQSDSAQRPIKIEGDSFYEKLENLKRDGIVLSRLYTLLKEYCTEQNCMNFINIDELINLLLK